jgi:heptosyltransferase-2
MKIGVMLPNWVGDLCMATPTLRALARRYPDAQITGIARPYLLPLLDGTPWLTRRVEWEHRGRGWMGRTWRLIRSLRRERLDALLLLRNSGFAAGVARLSCVPRSIGYARRGSRLFLSTAILPPRSSGGLTPVSAVDYYLRLAGELDCSASDRTLELATTCAEEAAADVIWRRLALPDPRQTVLLHVGGAYGSAKHWPREHCLELSRRLAAEFGLTVVILCGPAERGSAAQLACAAMHPRVKSLAQEDLGFGPTKALIGRSRLLITTDSGPRHIAAALSTPTITLLGPIDPRWSENHQPNAIHLRLPLACSPCGQRTCPLGHHRCLRDLTPDLVLHAVDQQLRPSQWLQVA